MAKANARRASSVKQLRLCGVAAVTLAACLTPFSAHAGAIEATSSLQGVTDQPDDAPPRATDTALAIPALPSGETSLTNVAWDMGALPNSHYDGLTVAAPDAAAISAAYGPQAPAEPESGAAVDAVPLDASGHVPAEFASTRGFGRQVGSIKTEMIVMSAYVLAQSVPKFFKDTTSFHFKDEGWFGKDTHNIGVDKLTHAFNTYLIAEILHARLHRNTAASEGDALTAGILAAGLMAINELSDGIEPDSGYSMNDIAMNFAGAGFSVLRNTVPGLKEKLAFKIEVMPNDQIYSRRGKKHYEQQRFMLSLKGTGFKALDNSALRYLDLQVGYYASDFLNSDRERGIEPKRHLFAGIGINLGELLFGKSRSGVGKALRSGLDYFQVPYTSVRVDTHGRFNY